MKQDINEEKMLAALERANAIIDMHAPLVWQMWKLRKEEYLPWVHEPFSYAGTHQKDAQLFGWSFLEPLTKTSWYVIPLVWIPIATYFMYPFMSTASISASILAFAAGLFVWTFFEYSVHRLVFHLDDLVPDAPFALLLHFLLHGIHHKIPMDRYRLVMPPVLFAALASTGWFLFVPIFQPLLGDILFRAVFGAVLIGYVLYDMMHYSQHHIAFSKGSYLANMKAYHMKHHYSGQQNYGFGITSKFWDFMFGTVLDMNKKFSVKEEAQVYAIDETLKSE